MSAYTIALAHHAGGVGKTISALNIGYGLAVSGARVLLVDLDPQGDLSTRLDIAPAEPTLGTALIDPSRAPRPVLAQWGDVTLAVLPGDLNMAGVELALIGVGSRELRLKNALTVADPDGAWAAARDAYDYIIVDCPPSLSTLTQNAFYAADGVIVPVQAHDKAYMALPLLFHTIGDVNRFRQTPLRLLGLLVTMLDQTVMARQIADALRAEYGDKVFQSIIPARVAARAEHRRHAPVSFSAPDDATAVAYSALAEEVITRAQ